MGPSRGLESASRMSTRKRGDKWLVTVELGRDRAGRRLRHCSTHGTEDAAKKAEAIAKAKVATETWISETSLTVDAYLVRWLAHRKHDLAWATYATYKGRIEGKIRERLGGMKLRKLRPLHIVDFEAYLYECGLSATTVRKYRMVLHGALRNAVEWGLIAKNPAHGLDPIAEDTGEVRWLAASEQAALLDLARSGFKGRRSRLYPLILLGLATGARMGELLALRWADVDFAASKVAVRRGQQKGEHGPTYRRGGKQGRGRVVALPDVLVGLLAEHRREQARARATVGAAWTDVDLVFCGAAGEPWKKDGVESSFRYLRRRAGLSADIHFHCLRHTFATELLAAGVHPKIVSEALGHSSVRLTLDRYSHAIPHLQTEAAAVMDTQLRALGVDAPRVTASEDAE